VANGAKHNAFSLVELLVVLGIIAALAAIAIPSIKAMQKSFDSTGAESMISTALSTARTIAISKQRYAGVRFQKIYDGNDSVFTADQYMIFIIYDNDNKATNWDCGYVAVEGYKPMKLPSNIQVIDKMFRSNRGEQRCNFSYTENGLASASELNNITNFWDTSTFTVIFSPTGKIAINDIKCRGRISLNGKDQVFNTKINIEAANSYGMFLEDYQNEDLGMGLEKSRKTFYILDKDKFNKMTASQRWDYLQSLKPCTLNPYTGQIVVSR
jgi:prepilin-type N-terminal cleavage/methylation domain-containing protein